MFFPFYRINWIDCINIWSEIDIMKQSLVFLACCLAISSVKCGVVPDVSGVLSNLPVPVNSLPVVGSAVQTATGLVDGLTSNLPVVGSQTQTSGVMGGLPVSGLLNGLPVNPLSLVSPLQHLVFNLLGGLPLNAVPIVGQLPVSGILNNLPLPLPQ